MQITELLPRSVFLRPTCRIGFRRMGHTYKLGVTMNSVQPQAKAIFEARMGEIVIGAEREINNIKSECNARNILVSSITVRQIFQHVEKLVTEIGAIAEQCATLSFEAGSFPLNDKLQAELLESFEVNFSSGYSRLVSLADSSTHNIRQSLTNSGLSEWGRLPEVAKAAQVTGQANLRKYYQDLRKRRKKWYDHFPPIAALFRLFIHG
jgi:hypothetical protein